MTVTVSFALLLAIPAAPLFASPEEVDAAVAEAHMRRAERLSAAGRYVEAAVAYHCTWKAGRPANRGGRQASAFSTSVTTG